MFVNLAVALSLYWLNRCYPDVVWFPTHRPTLAALGDDQPLGAVFDRHIKCYAHIADVE